MSYSAQNSITIKRLRSSDSLILMFGNNGIPLFQAIDKVSGQIAPDWTVPANQPVRIPVVTSTRGLPVSVISHSWSHNGNLLVFNGEVSEGWQTDSTGKFRINDSGSIKIIQNLATTDNYAGDILSYTTQVRVAGVEYSLSGSLEIVIQEMGASSYYATILAETEILDSGKTSTNVTTRLYQGVTQITNYYTKWYKDFDAWTDKNGQNNIVVTRDDISGGQLFIAEMYKTSAANEPVLAKAGVRILDNADDYKVILDITSTDKMVYKDPLGVDHNVTVAAKIVNTKTNSVYAPAGAVWRLDVMNRENWTSLKTSNTNTIIVTPAETDRNEVFYDVDVMAEVEF